MSIFSTIKTKKITLTSSQVLDLNKTPVDILGELSGYFYDIISCTLTDNGTTPYSLASYIFIYNKSATTSDSQVVFGPNIAIGTWKGKITNDSASSAQLFGSDPVTIVADTSDPTSGDGDWILNITYREVKL